jgi:hypothetical protein
LPWELDEVPFPKVLELVEYWRDNPPVHQMVRAYLGIGKQDSAPPAESVPLNELGGTLAAYYGGGRKSLDHLPAGIQQALADQGLLTFGRPDGK